MERSYILYSPCPPPSLPSLQSNTHKCKLLALACFLVAMSSMIFALLYEDGGVLTLEAEQSTSKKAASLFVLLTSCCDVFCLSNRVTEYAALLKVRE